MSEHVPIERPAWLDRDVWPFPIDTVPTDRGRVAYTDVGDGPALFFLNLPQWSLIWRDVIVDLARDHRCVTLDAPGLGLSDRVPAAHQHLGVARDAVIAVVDRLELAGAGLVVHDLGGLAGLAAAARRPAAFEALAAVNTFGWRPSGVVLPTMLAVFGSSVVRRLDEATGALPMVTSGSFGVGRRLDAASRGAFRDAFDARSIGAMHRLFADAATNREIHDQAESGLARLAPNHAALVFGSWGDSMGFRRRWRRDLDHVTEVDVPRGLHFPMNDDPELVATALRAWRRGFDGRANGTGRPGMRSVDEPGDR